MVGATPPPQSGGKHNTIQYNRPQSKTEREKYSLRLMRGGGDLKILFHSSYPIHDYDCLDVHVMGKKKKKNCFYLPSWACQTPQTVSIPNKLIPVFRYSSA